MRASFSQLAGVWQGRKRTLLRWGAAGAIIGIAVSFFIPRYYRAALSFYPVNLADYDEADPVEQSLDMLQGIDILRAVVDSLSLTRHYHFADHETLKAAEKLREHVHIYRTRFSSVRIEAEDKDAAMASRIATTVLQAYERKLRRNHRAFWRPAMQHRRRYVDSIEAALKRLSVHFRNAPEATAFVSGEEAFNELAADVWKTETRSAYYQALTTVFQQQKKRVPDSVRVKQQAYQQLLTIQQQRFDSVLAAYPEAAARLEKYRSLLLVYQKAIEAYEKARENFLRQYAYALISQPLQTTRPSLPAHAVKLMLIGGLLGLALAAAWLAWQSRPSE